MGWYVMFILNGYIINTDSLTRWSEKKWSCLKNWRLCWTQASCCRICNWWKLWMSLSWLLSDSFLWLMKNWASYNFGISYIRAIECNWTRIVESYLAIPSRSNSKPSESTTSYQYGIWAERKLLDYIYTFIILLPRPATASYYYF